MEIEYLLISSLENDKPIMEEFIEICERNQFLHITSYLTITICNTQLYSALPQLFASVQLRN
ncbi:hypothetical protein MTR_2g064000 [Medicago truncatula]|uniref:Uncharacterized protein n=1 Tax=Medicago truncatula TaxID=3880 RepID=G7IGV8_MEDTR|nr:hypothetical protein MTR_2g064000 [Medicago truncatula]